jgi:squalene-hopene/tetraprenyl-beta-curcumene cyclase
MRNSTRKTPRWLAVVFLASSTIIVPSASTLAEEKPEESRQRSIARGVSYLLSGGQAADGSFSKSSGPAVTAICLTSLLRSGLSPEHPAVARGLRYLEGFAREDGGVYQEESLYQNYETCLAMMCYVEANRDGRYGDRIKRAATFVKLGQWGAKGDIDQANLAHGGFGYGKHGRPDLSNTTFTVEALRSGGTDENDEAIQAALKFISRCQNKESEHNTTPFATKNPDGGFYYTPAAGGQSQAGMTAQGGLRSYGSMTYAGLKSMIFAGVGPDDPRIEAAMGWIKSNYSLEMNPGMGSSGLFYYYHTFAKALSTAKIEQLTDSDGKKHEWRAELIQTFAAQQEANGSWVNQNERWLEGDANLVTAYALLALSYCGH